MRTLLISALALGAMTSVAFAAGPAKPTVTPAGPFTLTETQMDKMTAGVCIGNCPGNKTQVGVNACVITRNCQPKNENN